MFLLFTEKYFRIIEPDIKIFPNINKTVKLLRKSGVKYKMVCDGYIIFPAKVFKTDLYLMVGLRYKKDSIERIEIFRPNEYYIDNGYDVEKSYQEISLILKELYGYPSTASNFDSSYDGRIEQWNLKYYIISHTLFDRFGLEERLSIEYKNN